MLGQQKWIKLAPDMVTAWRQAMEEGKPAGEYEAACKAAAEKMDEASACGLYARMMELPVADGSAYHEPDGLEEIRKARPKQNMPDVDQGWEDLEDKIRGAWLGRISGCLLGKPVEGYKSNRLKRLLEASGNDPMQDYIRIGNVSPKLLKELDLRPDACWADTITQAAPVDDDTNYTVLALKILETYGRNFQAEDVLEGWLRWLPYLATCTAERVAYRNGTMGLLPPESAMYHNPFREWIGAQIRGDFYGYINPGDPQAAAEMAWRDARVSHVKNGIYGEMFVAACIAAAGVPGGGIDDILLAGLGQIPKDCRLAEAIGDVMKWYGSGTSADKAIQKIHQRFDEYNPHDWCHVISNAMIVTAALLYGGGDFSRSICLAVSAAFDTDCNGATVGSIIGMYQGAGKIPEKWYSLYHEQLDTSISGYERVTVTQLVKKTLALISR